MEPGFKNLCTWTWRPIATCQSRLKPSCELWTWWNLKIFQPAWPCRLTCRIPIIFFRKLPTGHVNGSTAGEIPLRFELSKVPIWKWNCLNRRSLTGPWRLSTAKLKRMPTGNGWLVSVCSLKILKPCAWESLLTICSISPMLIWSPNKTTLPTILPSK